MKYEDDKADYELMEAIREKEKEQAVELNAIANTKLADKAFFSQNLGEEKEKEYIINRFRTDGYSVLIGRISKDIPLFIIKKDGFKKQGFNLKKMFDEIYESREFNENLKSTY